MSRKKVLYVDMDGVLVDWLRGLIQYVNHVLYNPKRLLKHTRFTTQEHDELFDLALKTIDFLGRDYMIKTDRLKRKFKDWTPLDHFIYRLVQNDIGWWVQLSWTSYGKELWELCKSYERDTIEVKILTSPMTKLTPGLGSKIGKMQWVYNNIGINTEVILESNKEKYAKNKSKVNFLVDDTLKKVDRFVNSGGKAFRILVDEMDNKETIAYQLNELQKSLDDWANPGE